MNLQPTIFISSIVSEFYDLRGALKYFLGKSGFRVLMSEEPDFGADCGIDSLDNCKKQIEKSDYYLLIIGNNSGTVFEINGRKTTVTFEEFKHYLNNVKNGKAINFIAFVRKQTWENYERKDTVKIDPLQIELINELINNSLFDDLKIGRWRYAFDRFSDIITILETNQNGLFLEATRKTHIYRSYIKREIFEILKSLIEKNRDTGELKAYTQIANLTDLKIDLFNPIKIDSDLAAKISGFIIIFSNRDTELRKINRVFNYIAQGEFSYFDPIEEKYVLPEYIKLILQTLEILEKAYDNTRNFEIIDKIRKQGALAIYLNGIEYSIVQGIFNDINLATAKLVNLVVYFNNNWIDLEKRPDSYYTYRKSSCFDISDEDIISFSENYFEGMKK